MAANIGLFQDFGKQIILVSKAEQLLGIDPDAVQPVVVDVWFCETDEVIVFSVEVLCEDKLVAAFAFEISINSQTEIIQRLLNYQGLYCMYNDLKKIGYLPGDFVYEKNIKSSLKRNGGVFISRLPEAAIAKLKAILKK
ncbi:MAG: hypothetical protein LLG02_08565 [Pelosinus sp.]|nr:hypothetical protein [Pelosinus sp.]